MSTSSGGRPVQTLSYQTPDVTPAGGKFDRWFHHFAVGAASAVGNKWAFVTAVAIIVLWAVTGPFFHFSDTWQLVINTGTTIITFVMVFLIQNTQNRDARAIHLKLDELIRALKGARTRLVNLEEMSDQEMNALREEFEHLRHRADKKFHESRHRIADAKLAADEARDTAASAHDIAVAARESADRAVSAIDQPPPGK